MNWWQIAKLELRLAARDREAVIWSLIAPIGMAWLFGTLFDTGPPRPTRVAIARGNNPVYVESIVAGFFEKEGLEIADSEDAIVVALPDSFITGILAGDRDVDIVVRGDDSSVLSTQSVAAVVRRVAYTLIFRARESWRDTPPTDAEIGALVAASGQLRLETASLGQRPRVVSGKMHQLPAMLVMFIMFQLMTFFLVLWVEDIKTGKIKRIVMSPTPIRDLFTALLISRGLWGVLQVAVILGVGSLVLGVQLDVPPGPFAVVLIAYMATATSLGLFAGTFFRATEKANAFGVIAGLVMAALGGCWWPLEIVSEPMRVVAMVFPTGLAMDAIGELLALGSQAPFPILNVVVLVMMTAILMPLAIFRMKRQLTFS